MGKPPMATRNSYLRHNWIPDGQDLAPSVMPVESDFTNTLMADLDAEMLLFMTAWEASHEYQSQPRQSKNKPLWLRLQLTDIYNDINSVSKADERPATMPGIRRAVTEIVAAMLGRQHNLPPARRSGALQYRRRVHPASGSPSWHS